MKLYRIRGGSEKELQAKQYTIGVGISLGNRWFTVNNIIELIEWSLSYSKDEVIVYVADSIHAINLEVRKRISFEKALRLADEMGDEILQKVQLEAERKFPQQTASRLVYAKWSELVDPTYQKHVDYLYSLYKTNTQFKNAIHSTVRDFVSAEVRQFSEIEINRLGMYIIEELPELINRVPINGVLCDAYAYPFDGAVTKFTEQIQRGEVFPEIKEHIARTKPKIFLEVR